MKFGKKLEDEIAELEDLKTTTTVRDLLPFVKYKHLKKVIKGKDQSCLTSSSVASASMECPLGADGPLTNEPNDRFFDELDNAVEELDSFFTRLTLNLTPFMPSSPSDNDNDNDHDDDNDHGITAHDLLLKAGSQPDRKRYKFDIDKLNAQLDKQVNRNTRRNSRANANASANDKANTNVTPHVNANANTNANASGTSGAVVMTVKTEHDTSKDEAATTAVLLLRVVRW
mmetsp:Transcript_64296/g.177964  ORF Transcript_64296/g.177964 Transcript_64296/m.177964 type:complete len:229 (-) Transcript_64296:69-755(-)